MMVDSEIKTMRWASALSTRPSLEAAIEEVVAHAQRSLQATADLGFVFISSAYASEYSRLLPLLQARLSVPLLIGCSGGGVVGVNAQEEAEEVEGKAALSLTLAHLPGVQIHRFRLAPDRLPDLDSPPDAWIDLIGVPPEVQPQFILFADPGSSGITELLQGLDYAYPDSVKVGGLAGINSFSGTSGLFLDDRHYETGVIGVALSGNIVLETIVAQGCRPIGQPYRIAAAERNIVTQLEDQASSGVTHTPLDILQATLQELDDADRALAQQSLFVGIAQSAFKQTLEQGDFLIRNLLGVDPRTGAMAIGDRVRLGQRIQFHLRDADTSADDLRVLLERYQSRSVGSAPIGALMFACIGRGEELYNQPNFDSHLFNRYVDIPIGGFFCNGEIGPVGGTTFLHGYTSVFGICREKQI